MCKKFASQAKLVNTKSKISIKKQQILTIISSLRVHWRLSMILKANKKWSYFFLYVKVCIFWKCIQYTIHWDKTQMLKKPLLDKLNRKKNAHFFLSRAPTHYSFTFNLLFLYEMRQKVQLPKTVCGIFHFWFRFVFIKVYTFVQQNVWTLWLSNVLVPFKIKIIQKPHTVLLPDPWFLSYNKKF